MKFDFHENHRLLFGTVVVGFVVLSGVVAVAPALWLQRSATPTPGSRALTALERRGRDVYLSEGCVYCHTQQVRPLTQDTSRYGRASVAGDYARLLARGLLSPTPRVLGTERTGPDLTNIAARQPSATWHYIHLYQPRAVVPASIMPSFPWLFAESDQAGAGDSGISVPSPYAPSSGVVVPTERGRALVAYLLALQGANPPAASRPSVASPATDSSAAPLAAARSTAAAGTVADAGRGERIYAGRCAACHQASGSGLAGAFPPLAGDPVVTAADAARHIEIVLFGASGSTIGGVHYGSPMPAWGELMSDDEIAAVINHERSSWGNQSPQVTSADVAAVRARGDRHAR